MSKTSDNVNLDFPARMADGRIFTDYRPNCVMNSEYSKGKNSFEYRYHLTHNGTQIEQSSMKQLEERAKCNDCNAQTLLPVQTVQNCNAGICTISVQDPNGLGLDRSNTYKK
jgi:hypothetical protein